ncbi:MAG: hypothetical protein LV481_02730 [Methylacidiphilales bacterium]|nr:hypothetical protein [Candidatus Methylacidiphilales bacterium]
MLPYHEALNNYTYILQPEPFREFWSIWAYCLLSMGGVMTIFFSLVGAFGLMIYSRLVKRLSELKVRLIQLGTFSIILLPVGGFFNALWCCLVFGNLYVSYDYDGPEDGFTPFFPIDRAWLNELHGYTLTCSLPELQLVWFCFAAMTWVISFILYRFIRQIMGELILRQAQDDGKLETKNSVNLVIP